MPCRTPTSRGSLRALQPPLRRALAVAPRSRAYPHPTRRRKHAGPAHAALGCAAGHGSTRPSLAANPLARRCGRCWNSRCDANLRPGSPHEPGGRHALDLRGRPARPRPPARRGDDRRAPRLRPAADAPAARSPAVRPCARGRCRAPRAHGPGAIRQAARGARAHLHQARPDPVHAQGPVRARVDRGPRDASAGGSRTSTPGSTSRRSARPRSRSRTARARRTATRWW